MLCRRSFFVKQLWFYANTKFGRFRVCTLHRACVVEISEQEAEVVMLAVHADAHIIVRLSDLRAGRRQTILSKNRILIGMMLFSRAYRGRLK